MNEEYTNSQVYKDLQIELEKNSIQIKRYKEVEDKLRTQFQEKIALEINTFLNEVFTNFYTRIDTEMREKLPPKKKEDHEEEKKEEEDDEEEEEEEEEKLADNLVTLKGKETNAHIKNSKKHIARMISFPTTVNENNINNSIIISSFETFVKSYYHQRRLLHFY
jgi:hypothetical protein